MVRTQIQLTEEQARRVKKMAGELGISSAELIRRALDEVLSKSPQDRQRRMRALEIIGIGNSGTGDLSSRHDEYLQEIYGQ